MTYAKRFIAGDWGTSNLRLYLCEYNSNGTSKILDTRSGPGINHVNETFEEVFFNLAQSWLETWGPLPAILSGMIGSTIGWVEAPYLSCPASAAQIAAGRVKFKARGIDISILAGLKTKNPLGAADVMRGEELQLLGWLRSQSKPSHQKVFALPGTHNKWALVENGAITSFLTAFTGELFSVLRDHSMLIGKQAGEQRSNNINEGVFSEGLQAIDALGESQLLHALFSTRSRQVLGEMTNSDATSYLSGLIIGADVLGAATLFGNTGHITIIGEPSLSHYYKRALSHFGFSSECVNPSDIAISGFSAVFEHIIKANNDRCE